MGWQPLLTIDRAAMHNRTNDAAGMKFMKAVKLAPRSINWRQKPRKAYGLSHHHKNSTLVYPPETSRACTISLGVHSVLSQQKLSWAEAIFRTVRIFDCIVVLIWGSVATTKRRIALRTGKRFEMSHGHASS